LLSRKLLVVIGFLAVVGLAWWWRPWCPDSLVILCIWEVSDQAVNGARPVDLPLEPDPDGQQVYLAPGWECPPPGCRVGVVRVAEVSGVIADAELRWLRRLPLRVNLTPLSEEDPPPVLELARIRRDGTVQGQIFGQAILVRPGECWQLLAVRRPQEVITAAPGPSWDYLLQEALAERLPMMCVRVIHWGCYRRQQIVPAGRWITP